MKSNNLLGTLPALFNQTLSFSFDLNGAAMESRSQQFLKYFFKIIKLILVLQSSCFLHIFHWNFYNYLFVCMSSMAQSLNMPCQSIINGEIMGPYAFISIALLVTRDTSLRKSFYFLRLSFFWTKIWMEPEENNLQMQD